MQGTNNIRSYGYTVGTLPTGPLNSITDVPDVLVGHCTVEEKGHKTGVTSILPCSGNIYMKKPVASVYTLNGYGKTAGTIQIEELGVIETPICLTNTLNVGKVSDALIEYTKEICSRDEIPLRSINPIVGETNDSHINPILERIVNYDHVMASIQDARKNFQQGCVGAGRGTICFGLKGGIGSSSRILNYGRNKYTLGALVQSNFGRMEDLTLCGEPIGRKIASFLNPTQSKDKGSIMVVIATDIPLSSRQLTRILKRATVGLVRTGSFMGHGSGDVFIGFTNGNFFPEIHSETLLQLSIFPEEQIDLIFRMAAEAVEEAIYNSMIFAHAEVGTEGETYHWLGEFLPTHNIK